MLHLTRAISIDEAELDWQPVRAQGAGGQNVNKVASAIHLRFDIRASSLPPGIQERLLALRDQRITQGVLLVKEPGICPRFNRIPGAPFIHDQSHFLFRIILIHDRTVTLEQFFHVTSIAQNIEPFRFGKAGGCQTGRPIVATGVVV